MNTEIPYYLTPGSSKCNYFCWRVEPEPAKPVTRLSRRAAAQRAYRLRTYVPAADRVNTTKFLQENINTESTSATDKRNKLAKAAI